MIKHACAPGKTYWITGFSGAGKTTLCHRFVDYLRAHERTVVMLDGDELRAIMGAVDGHARKDRLALAKRYGQLCRLIASQGVDVAIATISMFHEVHAWNRQHLPGYVEIFIDVPFEELIRRDARGIYGGAEKGETKNVAGLDLNVEIPQAPDVHIQWAPGLDEDKLFQQLLDNLRNL